MRWLVAEKSELEKDLLPTKILSGDKSKQEKAVEHWRKGLYAR